MRVAFLASRFLDPDNSRSWSGLPFFIRRALEGADIETITIATEDIDHPRRWARFLFWRWMHSRRYLIYCDAKLLQSHARQFERRLAGLNVDAVFSPSTWPLAYLETELPVLFWTDACFAGLLNFYESFTAVAPPSVRAGHAIEQRALDRCARAIYSSEWAAATARKHYRIGAEKIEIVPFGGNLHEPPALERIATIVEQRAATPCRLLLVGVDWKRKGVDIAIDATTAVRGAGIDAQLTIVGCRPPDARTLPAFVEVLPFIGKNTTDERERLAALYERSHFFILPSRAEAFGIVLAEACAYGVPCLTTRVGGLPSVIADGVNGHLFSVDARGEEYAAFILELMRAPQRYRELALGAAQEAATRLSWKVSGRRIAEILYDLLQSPTRAAPLAPAVVAKN